MAPSFFVRLATVAGLGASLLLAFPLQECPAGDSSSAAREIDELIARLASENFEVREAAARVLLEREDAIPALRRACKSLDAEVARRAGEILGAFARKEKERAFASLADLAKHGAIDQAVERLVRREKWDDEAGCWQVMFELAGKLADLERQTYGKASLQAADTVPARDFRRYAAAHGRDLKMIAADRAADRQLTGLQLVVRVQQIDSSPPMLRGFFARCGNLEGHSMHDSVIFSGGSVEMGSVADSVIVCDGDFTARSGLTNSLVIARGTVSWRNSITNSRVISCGAVKSTMANASKIVEKEPNPLDFVKFFDPAEVGIKVEKADGGVRVKDAAKGQRFAAAGLEPDDLLTTMNGEAVKDAEHFRRLLPARLAVEDEMVFKVRRAGQGLEVKVAGKEVAHQ